MKNLGKLLVILFTMFSLSNAQELANIENQEPVADVKKEEVKRSFKIGTDPNYPPFEYMSVNFETTGFDIELIDALSKKLNFDYELVNLPFDKLLSPSLEDGTVDMVISCLLISEERKKVADFSEPYYFGATSYLKKRDNVSIKTKEDLSGKRVGIEKESLLVSLVKPIKDVIIVEHESNYFGINELKQGNIDVLLIDSVAAMNEMKRNPGIVEFLQEIDGYGTGIAFKKGKYGDFIQEINAALKELKADGTYDKLIKKYNLPEQK